MIIRDIYNNKKGRQVKLMVNKRLLNAAKPNAKPHMGVGNCFSNLA